MVKKILEPGTLVIIRHMKVVGLIIKHLGTKECQDPDSDEPYENNLYSIDSDLWKNKEVEDAYGTIFELLKVPEDEMKAYLYDCKTINEIISDHLAEIIGIIGMEALRHPLPSF